LRSVSQVTFAGGWWLFHVFCFMFIEEATELNNKRVLMLVEIGVMVAFAYVLMLFRVGRMPQGGSISLQMLPIFVVALRWGGVPGMVAGLLFGSLKLMFDPFIVHPVQTLLDYPLAFAVIGVTGFLRDKPLAGIIAGGISRFFMHFLAGVVFFGNLAPEGVSAASYSFTYNMAYMGPEILIALFTTPLVLRRIGSATDKGLDLSNNLVEILSFVAPLAAMALVVGLRKSYPPLNYAALALWVGLGAYHVSRLQKDPQAAKRGLLMVSIPPAVVYIAFKLVQMI
jgi:thiamine transporter